MTESQKEVFEQARTDMIAEEKARRYMKRNTKGDASETGLVRFVTPCLMKEYGGPVETAEGTDNALDQFRNDNPVLRGDDKAEFAIPFNSNIK